jgi:tRNA U38,U39,U40 pseudouridine synthase TruA
VHASGQVVAFDIPVNLLGIDGNSNRVDASSRVKSDICTNNLCNKDGTIAVGDGSNNELCKEALSQHSIQLLRDAYTAVTTHNFNKPSGNKDRDNDTKAFIDQWQIRRAITTRLPADIVLRSVQTWTGQRPFETRKEIACKTYIYKLRFRCLSYLKSNLQSSDVDCKDQECNNGRSELQIHPICKAGPHILRRINDQNAVWLCQWPLDPTMLNQTCKAFVGRHDFYNFVHKEERKKADEQKKEKECNANNDTNDDATENKSPHDIDLFQFTVDTLPEEEEDPSLPPVINATFTLKAKGFHRSMVRNLVGFTVDVARGAQHVDDIPVLLMEKKPEKLCVKNEVDNRKALASIVNSAPACGLCLAKVKYEHDHFL